MPHCPLRDMVKFRKSAVNAGSRDQLASSYRRHILGRRFQLYLGLRLEMAMTKSVGPRPEPCSILSLMVQRGEIAEGKKFLSTIGGMGSVVSPPPIGVWGRSPRNRRNFEHLIPNGVHFGLLFASQFSKVGGDRPNMFESWGGRVHGRPNLFESWGDASHGSHRVVAPMVQA